MGNRKRFICVVPVLLGLLLAAGHGVEAQEAEGDSAPALEEVELAGPQLGPSPEQVQLFPSAAVSGGAMASHEAQSAPGLGASALQRRGGPVSLMAAGGVLLFAGAIIGGDAGTLVMVGGAGALAWGAYLYF